MKRTKQRSLYCSCGKSEIVACGLCGTCYTLKRQDEEYFGGLREVVLDRDDRHCRVCDVPGGRKRSLAVHHRVPGRSELHLMITLCLSCHAKVSRTTSLCGTVALTRSQGLGRRGDVSMAHVQASTFSC